MYIWRCIDELLLLNVEPCESVLEREWLLRQNLILKVWQRKTYSSSICICARCKILQITLPLLIKEEFLKENKDFLNRLVLELLPFMVITNNDSKSAEWKVALGVAESGLCSLHPLLKGWPEGKSWKTPVAVGQHTSLGQRHSSLA